MYRLVIFISLMLLSGCSGLANPFSAAAYVASEYVYDKPPIQFIADFFGILGGLIACVTTLDVNSYQFVKGLRSWFNPWDPIFGILKAISFGYAVTSIACYFGFYTTGGAQGVGKATTSTVVCSCVAILILDYFLAEILL